MADETVRTAEGILTDYVYSSPVDEFQHHFRRRLLVIVLVAIALLLIGVLYYFMSDRTSILRRDHGTLQVWFDRQ